MTRSIDPLFDPRLADWLEEDESTAPERSLEIVLASFPSIKQRRAVRVPWRYPMSSNLRLGLAAAVVVAATLGGIYFLGSRSDSQIAAPTPSPSASATEPPGSDSVGGNLSTFSSTQYGYSVEYPTPWAAVPATEAWTGEAQLGPEEPWADRFFAPNSATFVLIAALPRPDGVTDQEFEAQYQQKVAERECAVPLDTWTDATVGDLPAQRAEFECGGSPGVELMWIAGDSGYVISGEPAVVNLMADTFSPG
jgi:hypothetical protein